MEGQSDPLTGAYSRNKFLETLDVEMERTTRYLTPLSLLILYIDGLDRMKETYGRNRVDRIFVTVADIVQGLIRKTDLITRWKDEEVIILLRNTTEENGFYLAERIRKAVEGFNLPGPGGEDFRNITCSLGICEYMPNDSMENLMNRLAGALAKAREKGGSRTESG